MLLVPSPTTKPIHTPVEHLNFTSIWTIHSFPCCTNKNSKYSIMEKENMLKTPPKVPIQTKALLEPECKTPITPASSCNELRKPVTPDRLRVPKAFRYPERYTSPTDLMVSPVTKGLLARSKKGGALLPPCINQLKNPDKCLQDVGPIQNKVPMLTDEKIN